MTYNFDQMLQVLRQTQRGRLIDSFIRVEFGQDNLIAGWDAFCDIAKHFNVQYPGLHEMVFQFVIELEDTVSFTPTETPSWI